MVQPLEHVGTHGIGLRQQRGLAGLPAFYGLEPERVGRGVVCAAGPDVDTSQPGDGVDDGARAPDVRLVLVTGAAMAQRGHRALMKLGQQPMDQQPVCTQGPE